MVVQFILRVYTLLVGLYPKEFRTEFEEEMRAVFSDALEEAVERDRVSLVVLCLRELRDLPKALVCEYWLTVRSRKQETKMSEALERSGKAGEKRPPLPDGPSSWGKALVGAALFMVVPWLGVALGTLFLYLDLPRPLMTVIAYVLVFTGLGALLAILGLGCAKGFPRWVYPYWGVVLAFASLVLLPDMHIWIVNGVCTTLTGLLALAVIAILLGRLWRPLRSLYDGIWQDWTRLSFGFYGGVLLAAMLVFDDYPPNYEDPYVLASSAILSIGAFAYLRSGTTWQRIAALLACMTLAWVVTTAGVTFWGREEFGMTPQLPNWPGRIPSPLWMIRNWIALVVLMIVPSFLALRRRLATVFS